MCPACSLARNVTSGAALSGSRSVPTACSLGHLPVCSNTCRPRGVESIMRVAPLGMMELAVTLYLAMPLAVDHMSPMMPALAAPQLGCPGEPSADTDDMEMMRPYFCSRMWTEAARVQK